MSVEFKIPGKIKAKARPRFANGRTYTPKDTVNYENYIKILYQQVTDITFEGAVWLDIAAYFQIPKSYSKKKIANTPYPIKKPDADNIGKIVADSLNGIAYRDDSQIAEMRISKRWSKSEEYVLVKIGSIE